MITLQTNFSKTKITRLLDDLEKKGIVTRKPHGMMNKIIVSKKPARNVRELSF